MTVTDYIRDDLQARIESGDGFSGGPTLKGLAEQYNVSVTPVRRALDQLIEKQLILKRPNGRVIVNPSSLGVGKPHVKLDALRPRKDWFRTITDDVIRQSFQGKSVYLREEAAARKYGVSRTVVRQVFHRLAGSGVFEHIPRRGWRVRAFEYEDARAFYRVREVMELTALDLARPNLVRAELEEILAETPIHQPGASLPLDDRLHKYLIEKSRNRYIQDFFERHAGFYFYRTLFDFEHDEAEVAEAVKHHRQILEALLAQNWPGAREALSQHIRYQLPAIEKMIAKVISEAAVTKQETQPCDI